MSPPPAHPPLRVCLLGFGGFEKNSLASALRLAIQRWPTYVPAVTPRECDLVVVDADQAESLAEVVRSGLVERAVYVGSQLPLDASGWMQRPIDTKQLLAELDVLAAMHFGDRASPASAGTSPNAAAAASELTSTLRALLVDDSEIALRFLETRLHRHGVQTERAVSSGKAIELLSQQAFDLVFLDVELGNGSDFDGLALCQHIKRFRHHAGSAVAPTVVLVSAHHSELDRARGALAGCDAYLGKPLDEEVLNRLLRQQGAGNTR
jgi:CheY-like chemotaxis protein